MRIWTVTMMCFVFSSLGCVRTGSLNVLTFMNDSEARIEFCRLAHPLLGGRGKEAKPIVLLPRDEQPCGILVDFGDNASGVTTWITALALDPQTGRIIDRRTDGLRFPWHSYYVDQWGNGRFQYDEMRPWIYWIDRQGRLLLRT